MKISLDDRLKANENLPSDIIGSMVKQWPGFMTPTALFSASRPYQKTKIKNRSVLPIAGF